jgi:hypothetical protein
MRSTPWLLAEKYRAQFPGYVSGYGDDFGVFILPLATGTLTIIASSGDESLGPDWAWEHVSVSLKNRTPNWAEMCRVKDLFWDESETVMQLHVPASDHRNLAETCLHLWRPTKLAIPRPPSEAVAVPGSLADNIKYLIAPDETMAAALAMQSAMAVVPEHTTLIGTAVFVVDPDVLRQMLRAVEGKGTGEVLSLVPKAEPKHVAEPGGGWRRLGEVVSPIEQRAAEIMRQHPESDRITVYGEQFGPPVPDSAA